MDSAYCTSVNRVYDAAEFARLAPHALEQNRRALRCNSCGAEAFFRSASTSGRGPCFGARPHVPDCPEATVDAGTWGIGGTDVTEPIFNDAGQIIIDLPRPDREPGEADVGGAEYRRRGAGRLYGGDGGVGTNATRRRLTTLLRRLTTEPHFQSYDTVIRPPDDHPPTTVREFFVPFENARVRALGQYKGLWGLITDASYGTEGALWLNTGDRSSISFVVSAELVPDFLARWDLADTESIAGAQALILATPRRSQNGKLFAPIGDLRHVVLDVA